MPPYVDAREDDPIGVAAADPSQPILERTRALAAAGDLDAAIAALRDFLVEFPQYGYLGHELDTLRRRANHEAAPTAFPQPEGTRLPYDLDRRPAPSTLPVSTSTRGPGVHRPNRQPRTIVVVLTVAALLVFGVTAAIVLKRVDPAATPGVSTSSSVRADSTADPVTHASPQSQTTAVDLAPTLVVPSRPVIELSPSVTRRPRQPARVERSALSPLVMASRRPGESEVSWRVRSRDLDFRYRSAKAAIARGHNADALIWLSAVIQEDASYRDVPELLEQVYRARRARAAGASQEGLELEQRGDLADAAERYELALATDPDFTEAVTRLSAVRATISKRVVQAMERAAVEEAFGLTADAAQTYEQVLKLVPSRSGEHAIAAQKLAGLWPRTPPLLTGEMPSSMKLKLVRSNISLRFVTDPAGGFAAKLPMRRWQLTSGADPMIGIVTERAGRGSLLVEAVSLADRLSLDASYDLVVEIEARLVASRDPAATFIIHRVTEPAVPMVILDYRRPGPGGEIRHVRQYSMVREQTLYRISAMNGSVPFSEIEGVFNDFALSFRPKIPARAARP